MKIGNVEDSIVLMSFQISVWSAKILPSLSKTIVKIKLLEYVTSDSRDSFDYTLALVRQTYDVA